MKGCAELFAQLFPFMANTFCAEFSVGKRDVSAGFPSENQK
jgi:hypothetical protein